MPGRRTPCRTACSTGAPPSPAAATATSEIAGQRIETEDLVNLPDWLPLALRIEGGDWLRPDSVDHLDYRPRLDLRAGLLLRDLRFRDPAGRVARREEQRFVFMDDPHAAVLALRLVPGNWPGRVELHWPSTTA